MYRIQVTNGLRSQVCVMVLDKATALRVVAYLMAQYPDDTWSIIKA